MKFLFKIEHQIEQNQKKAKELLIQHESLEQEIIDFLMDLKLTSQQLTQFLEKRDNFTDKNWEELLKQRKELESKLKRELSNIVDPRKKKKTYDSLHVERHWIQVR